MFQKPGAASIIIALLGIGLLGSAACKKRQVEASTDAGATPAAPAAQEAEKPARSAAAPASANAEKIPGESDVRSAMAEKNYSTAVERLIALKGLIASPEQREEYGNLFGQVRSDLQDAASRDPKAAEALMTLRTLRNGR